MKRMMLASLLVALINSELSYAQILPAPTETAPSPYLPSLTEEESTHRQRAQACFDKCKEEYEECVIHKATIDCYVASPSCISPQLDPITSSAACSAEVASCLASRDLSRELDYPTFSGNGNQTECTESRNVCDTKCAHFAYRAIYAPILP